LVGSSGFSLQEVQNFHALGTWELEEIEDWVMHLYYALLKDDLLASVWEQQWKNGLKSPCCFSALEFKKIHDTAVVSRCSDTYTIIFQRDGWYISISISISISTSISIYLNGNEI